MQRQDCDRTSSSWRRHIAWAAFVLASLGFHGLILFLPISTDDPPEDAVTEASSPEVLDTIALTPLATPEPTVAPAPPAAEPAAPDRPAPVPAPLTPAPPPPAPTEAPPPEPQPAAADPDSATAEVPEESAASLAERLQDLGEYGDYDGSQVKSSGDEKSTAYLTWWTSLDPNDYDGQAPAHTPEKTTLSIDYALERCLATPPATAYMGVVIDAQGEVRGEVTVLSSTGYSLLDEAAQAVIQQQQFTAPSDLTAYSVEVAVDNYPQECPGES